MANNLSLEMRRKGTIEAILSSFHGRDLDEVAGQMMDESVMGSFARRAGESRLTGEFIVYEPRRWLQLLPDARSPR
jgi:hypothetical protein